MSEAAGVPAGTVPLNLSRGVADGLAIGRGHWASITAAAVVFSLLPNVLDELFNGMYVQNPLGLWLSGLVENGYFIGMLVWALVYNLTGGLLQVAIARDVARVREGGRSQPIQTIADTVARLPSYFGVNLMVLLTSGLGLLLLVVPGIIVMIATLFVAQAVAVETWSPVRAFAFSWDLTRGNRWRLLGVLLAIIVLLVGVLIGVSLLVEQFVFGIAYDVAMIALFPVLTTLVEVLVGLYVAALFFQLIDARTDATGGSAAIAETFS